MRWFWAVQKDFKSKCNLSTFHTVTLISATASVRLRSYFWASPRESSENTSRMSSSTRLDFQSMASSEKTQHSHDAIPTFLDRLCQSKVLHSLLMNSARMWSRPQGSTVNLAMRWKTKSNVYNFDCISASLRWKTRPLLLLVLPLICHLFSFSNSKSFNKFVGALHVFIFYFFASGNAMHQFNQFTLLFLSQRCGKYQKSGKASFWDNRKRSLHVGSKIFEWDDIIIARNWHIEKDVPKIDRNMSPRFLLCCRWYEICFQKV